MRQPMSFFLLFLLWTAQIGTGAAETVLPLQALLHISFEGHPQAQPDSVNVRNAEKLSYVEGVVGQAADFSSGACVDYTNLPSLHLPAGTIELFVKPLHEPQEREDHYYLQFLRADGSSILEITFTHVEMSAQVTIRTGKQMFRRYGWGWPGHRWNHLVITWDAEGASPTGLRLYINGKELGYPTSCQALEQPALLRIGAKEPHAGPWAKAHIDELTIYNRCLTRLQVKALASQAQKPFAEKLTAITALVAKEDAEEARLREKLFACPLGIIYGRYTSLLNWPESFFALLDIPVPTPLSEDALAQTDLRAYKVLMVPGGGGLRLTEENQDALIQYVKAGGGYVGICGGAITANKIGLIDCEAYNFNVRGSVWTKLETHPITRGYDIERSILFPHASGPLFVPKTEEQKTIAYFDVGNPPLPRFSHTIVRELGQGRVVAFSGHPESSPDTRPLLRQAIMWAARILE